MTNVNVLGVRVLDRIISNFNYSHYHTTKVPFLELQHSLEEFVSYKDSVRNKHTWQCIPLRRFTRQHHFYFLKSMKLVVFHAK
jgi:hypothetical protein